jgi:hypothetical protein
MQDAWTAPHLQSRRKNVSRSFHVHALVYIFRHESRAELAGSVYDPIRT